LSLLEICLPFHAPLSPPPVPWPVSYSWKHLSLERAIMWLSLSAFLWTVARWLLGNIGRWAADGGNGVDKCNCGFSIVVHIHIPIYSEFSSFLDSVYNYGLTLLDKRSVKLFCQSVHLQKNSSFGHSRNTADLPSGGAWFDWLSWCFEI
jgi:hypothetical protein